MRKPIVGRFLFGDVRAITSPVGTKKKKDPVLKIKDLPRGTRPRFGDKLLGFRVGSFPRWQKS